MPGYDWISLTTDYGLGDGFVAACHGAVARIAPSVRVIDVTHLVPPGDVVRGAAVLAQTVVDLPPAVHVAVVDPGVGTARRGVAVEAPGGLLVGPDNGLLLAAAEALGGVRRAVALTAPEWLAAEVSRTFHGRDVFAPVAARLALGADLAGAGPAVDPDGLVRLVEPPVESGPGWLAAPVLTVDHFGNVQLAARAGALDRLGRRLRIQVRPGGGDRERERVEPRRERELVLEATRVGTFGEAPAGALLVFADSAGRAAVAVNGGRADTLLSVRPGDVVRLADAG